MGCVIDYYPDTMGCVIDYYPDVNSRGGALVLSCVLYGLPFHL